MKIKIRKTWGEMDPATKVKGSKKAYNRAKARREMQEAIRADRA